MVSKLRGYNEPWDDISDAFWIRTFLSKFICPGIWVKRVFIKCHNRDMCKTTSPIIQKSQFSGCSPVSASLMDSPSKWGGGV